MSTEQNTAAQAGGGRRSGRWRRVGLIALAAFALFYAYRMIEPFYDRAWWAGECQFPAVSAERRTFVEQKLAELKPSWPTIEIGWRGQAFGGLGLELKAQIPQDLKERVSSRLVSLDRLAATREEQMLAMHLVMRDLGAHYRPEAEAVAPTRTN